MRSFWFLAALVAVLGMSLVAIPTTAAEKVDADKINQLIKDLASDRFSTREKAHKALEAVGLPALEPLRKVAEDDKADPEARRHAKELVEKLDKLGLSARVLKPTKVHLKYKDTPLKDALADFNKQSGQPITLYDPQNKLKDHKVTLDTGEVTFWEALDKFCEKAGLVEVGPNEALGVPQPPLPGAVPGAQGGGQGGIRIELPQIGPAVPAIPARPVKPLRKVPAQKEEKPQDARPKQDQPADKEAPAPAKKQAVGARPQVAVAQVGVAQAAAPVQIQAIPIQVQIQPAIQPVPVPPMPPFPGIGGGVPYPGQLVLKEGKFEPVPTSYVGAVRVRAIKNNQMFGAPRDKGHMVVLQISTEAKVQIQSLNTLRIEKALDDQDQALKQSLQVEDQPLPGVGVAPGAAVGRVIIRGRPAIMPAPAMVGYGIHHYYPIHLTRGEKAAKTLKELVGKITAQVLTAPETLIEVNNIRKASGTTAKGKNGGSIKVVNVVENQNQVTVTVEMENPEGVLPAQNFPGAVPVPPLPVPGGGAVPVPLPPQQGMAFQVGAAAPAQVKQIQVGGGAVQIQQIQIGGNIAIAQPGWVGRGTMNGLTLLDDKGNPMQLIGSGGIVRGGPGGQVMNVQHQLTYRVNKGQVPTKLIFAGQKQATIEIPFTLKNVPLN